MSVHVLTVCNRAGHYNEKKVKGPCNFGQTIQLLEREGTGYVGKIFQKKYKKLGSFFPTGRLYTFEYF